MERLTFYFKYFYVNSFRVLAVILVLASMFISGPAYGQYEQYGNEYATTYGPVIINGTTIAPVEKINNEGNNYYDGGVGYYRLSYDGWTLDVLNSSAGYTDSNNQTVSYLSGVSGPYTTFSVPSTFKVINTSAHVEIPNEPITGINIRNTNFLGVTEIILPASVKNVYSCLIQSVKSINLENVDTIGSLGSKTYYTSYFYPQNFNYVEAANGFRNCSQLESVDLSNVKFIGKQAFMSCTGLKEVTIHHNMAPFEAAEGYNNYEVNAIEQFLGCTGLEKVTFTGDSYIIPYKCFSGCNNIETVDFGPIETICAYAFSSDSKLKVADLSNVTRLAAYEYSSGRYDGYHFQGCTNLDTVKLGQQLNTIPYYSFSNCTNLKSINLENVVSFWGGALSGCSSLVIDNLDWTGKNMAFGSTPFEKVTLKFVHLNSETVLDRTPDISASANRQIFKNIKNSNIYIEDTNPANWSKADLIGPVPTSAASWNVDGWHSYYTSGGVNTNFTGANAPTNYLYVPAAALQTWRTAEGWSEIADRILPYPPRYVIIDGEKKMGNGLTFVDDDDTKTTRLTQIASYRSGDVLEIPGVFEDGYKTVAVTGCSGGSWSQVILPNTVDSLSDYAFAGCGSLETINLENITKIGGSNIFASCVKLDHVTLNPKLKTLPNYMFYNCIALSDINLDSVTVYGDYAMQSCISLNVHLDLRHATAIGQEAFANCALKSAWIGQATGLGMFSNPATPLNVYVFEEDPSKVSGTNVTTGLDTKSVVYVVCRNITSSEINKNPLDAFHQDAEWGAADAWKYVYPMLHQGNAIEREKTYTTFCFDKPLDFRGTDAEGTNYNVAGSDNWKLYFSENTTDYQNDRYEYEGLALRGMLQFYKQPENNTGGFINNRIEALAVTGFRYVRSDVPGTPESGAIYTAPAGIRPAGTGVLIHWHPGEEYHGGTGMTEYYPIPPVRDENGNRWTEEGFRAFFNSYSNKIRTGTYENNAGLTNCGGRNLERLEEGDEDGQYKDNYEGGTTTYNTTTGIYTGSEYDNLMIGNTVRIDSVFYKPWYYAYETDGEGHTVYQDGKPVLHKPSKDFDDNYKQFGLNPSCYFRRFYTPDEKESGSFMRAFRAYLRLPLAITGETENTTSGSPLLIEAEFVIGSSMDNDDQGGTTSVPNVNANENVNNGRYYTLDGRVLQGKPTQKGVYIMNGKKVVVK